MLDARGILTTVIVTVAAVAALIAADQKSGAPDWTIPPTATQLRSPIAPTPEVVAKGRKTFESKCQRCHGRDGRGNGPDAEADHPAGNLTDRLRAAFNPDGVMFYKVWNGRESPKMPAFKNEGLSADEVWTVIHFAKTFRK
jgi:mono/diheme cytochrome c family protein